MARDLTIKFLKTVAVLFVLYFLMWLLMGCKTGKNTTKESVDSVRVEYKEKYIKVPVTVYVEVPAEQKERFSPDSASHLETSFAVSDAKMIWIDGVAFLRHSLANKPQKIEKKDSVSIVEKEKTIWKTRRVTYTKTEYIEKKLSWWQQTFIWTGIIVWIVLFIFVIVKISRSYGGKLLSFLH